MLGTLFFLDPFFGKIAAFNLLCVLLSSYFRTVLAFFLTDFLEVGVKGGEVVCDVLPSLLWVLDVHKSIIILFAAIRFIV